ncbi:unnamed protein product [Phaeothamnion confervicola]
MPDPHKCWFRCKTNRKTWRRHRGLVDRLSAVGVLVPFFFSRRSDAIDVSFGGGCSNDCSGHGSCSDLQVQICQCYVGWAGRDCSQRLCPAATAWADYATAADTAHAALTECAGMGSGGTCSEHGRCTSMREAAEQVDYRNFFYEGTYDGWDADMIFGCACDPGYTGYDCSQRSCPYGPDPIDMTTADDVQIVDCTCPATCSGSILLSFMGQITREIPHDATAELVEFRLEELSTTIDVSVSFDGGNTALCSAAGTAASVTFLRPSVPRLSGVHWNLTAVNSTLASSGSSASPLVEVYSAGASSAVNASVGSVWGTVVDYECNRRGRCDRTSGLCLCYEDFGSSDGTGGEGSVGDCGYVNSSSLPTDCSAVIPSWDLTATAAACSGAGTCSGSSDLLCECDSGYGGWACDLMTCPNSTAWFDEAVDGVGHAAGTTCANGGTCEGSDGTCTCATGLFEGLACDLMQCVSNCSTLGLCHTMAELAANSFDYQRQPQAWSYSLWDADMVTGCDCNRSLAVDNALSLNSTTFRGPYAFADTDSFGYDCSLARCPRGDDPLTAGVNEVQRISCIGGFGTFTLAFRGAETVELQYDASADDVEAALGALSTLRNVAVTFEDDDVTTACAVPAASMLVEFITETGDLPILVAEFSNLFESSALSSLAAAGVMSVTEVTAGTREDVECAAHGVCDTSIGRCSCYVGYQSADDNGTAWGNRGDCGWRNDAQTELYRGAGRADPMS